MGKSSSHTSAVRLSRILWVLEGEVAECLEDLAKLKGALYRAEDTVRPCFQPQSMTSGCQPPFII